MNSIELQYSTNEIRPQRDRSANKSCIIQRLHIVKVLECSCDELLVQTNWRRNKYSDEFRWFSRKITWSWGRKPLRMFSFSLLLRVSLLSASAAFDIRVWCLFDFENSIRGRLLSRKIDTSAASVASHHLLHESPGVSWQSPYFTCPAVSTRIRSQFRAAPFRLIKTPEDLHHRRPPSRPPPQHIFIQSVRGRRRRESTATARPKTNGALWPSPRHSHLQQSEHDMAFVSLSDDGAEGEIEAATLL